jgi:hypothetical protein
MFKVNQKELEKNRKSERKWGGFLLPPRSAARSPEPPELLALSFV